jgi:hypothetical protein
MEDLAMIGILRAGGLALVAGLLLAPAARVQAQDPYRLLIGARGTAWDAPYLYLNQKTAQEREKTRRMRLETRKLELEHTKWEREFMLKSWQEEIEKNIQHEEKRARETPPLTEVVAGSSLNWLLRDLSKESRSPNSPSLAIKQSLIDHVTFVSTGGNASMLRQKQIAWPVMLQEKRFADSREQIESLLEKARADANRSTLTLDTLKALLEQHARLDDDLTYESKASTVWGPTQQVMAARFLKELKQTLLLLQNPKEAAFLLNHTPRCKTVAELVQHMREHALKFGPASAGNERHYVSLHAVLAREAQEVAKSRPAPTANP